MAHGERPQMELSGSFPYQDRRPRQILVGLPFHETEDFFGGEPRAEKDDSLPFPFHFEKLSHRIQELDSCTGWVGEKLVPMGTRWGDEYDLKGIHPNTPGTVLVMGTSREIRMSRSFGSTTRGGRKKVCRSPLWRLSDPEAGHLRKLRPDSW